MSVARRAVLAFGVVFLVTMSASATVFALGQSSSAQLTHYRARIAAAQDAMWQIRADFYNYDGQLNMYVAVLAGGGRDDDLAEQTYRQAVQAREGMDAALARARALAPSSQVVQLLDRLTADITAYHGFADQMRSAARAGDVRTAVRVQTRGNLAPSDAIMPTLDEATRAVEDAARRELAGLEASSSRLRQVSIGSAVIIAAMLTLLAAGIRLIVLRPLSGLRERMSSIAAGEAALDARVEVVGRDEIAQVALAFNTMLDTLATKEAEIETAQGERERTLAQAFEKQRQAEGQVRSRAQTVIDETAQAVSGDLEDLTTQVELVRQAAATIDERVGVADDVTREVVAQAEDVERALASLRDSLKQVGGMAELIGGVADQTKLLALNATIEAARAGEAGRGFGVVANEVKDLAMTTARSTGQIAATIDAVEQQMSAMARAITDMSQGVTGIDGATGVLRQVAQDQYQVVDQLQGRVADTVTRIRAMSSLTSTMERRQHRRMPVGGPATLTLSGVTFPGQLLDVGEGGLKVMIDDAGQVASGQAGRVEFCVEGNEVVLEAQVVARSIDAQQNAIGLQFLDPQPNLTAEIRQLVGMPNADVTFF